VNGKAGAAAGAPQPDGLVGWDRIPERLHARGLRWTPQRRILIEVLAGLDGHVTGSRLVERCRAIDPSTTPSTVYRTLDVLEELGVISHSHGLDGREEFHVRPALDHGHLACRVCGETSELPAGEAAEFITSLRRDRQFEADLDHLTVVGRCRGCLSS
jgi:Fur family ferric uptake transcriptional regulator